MGGSRRLEKTFLVRQFSEMKLWKASSAARISKGCSAEIVHAGKDLRTSLRETKVRTNVQEDISDDYAWVQEIRDPVQPKRRVHLCSLVFFKLRTLSSWTAVGSSDMTRSV